MGSGWVESIYRTAAKSITVSFQGKTTFKVWCLCSYLVHASPCFIKHRFAFFGFFCLVSYLTISGSYLKHIGGLGGPHVAVVGAGPAGFYAAQHIAKENRRPSILIAD